MRIWCAVVVVLCVGVTSRDVPCAILARGGSRGLRLKALAPLAGVALLARAIRLGHHVCGNVIVSTNHFLIAIEAKLNGASVHWRSASSASDTASSAAGAREILATLPSADALLLLQLTSPFTCVDQLHAALQALPGADCVFAVTRSHKLRWQYTGQGRVRPLNLNPAARPRRQDWSGELIETGQFYLARASLVRAGLLQNENGKFVKEYHSEDESPFGDLKDTEFVLYDFALLIDEMSERIQEVPAVTPSCRVVEVPAVYSLEVDTPDDLALANVMLKTYKYLKQCF